MAGRAPGHQRGAAGAMVILFLPVLLVTLASLAGLGDALLLRHRVAQAADFGALAAVQCLDLDQLAQGAIVLLPNQVGSVARQYVLANLGPEASYPGGVAIEVDVFNPDSESQTDRVTGKTHEFTTVCVRVACGTEFCLGPIRVSYTILGHADASAVPR